MKTSKKIGLSLLGMVVVALLAVRFLVIDIIRMDAPGHCPNKYGIVLANRWNPHYTRNDWVTYHQPALERGEAEDEGQRLVGRITAMPGDTLWYNNERGTVSLDKNQQFSHPLVLPTKGVQLSITSDNIRFYAITIMLHEPSKVCIIGDSLCVSGKMVSRYTFQQDYYWIANPDTLHQPDSRSFGFIPHQSLIGEILDL